MWAEANKDIVCNSIEQMADLQEAAVYTDMLSSGAEHDIGLETFAMAAALNTNPNLRYDFTKYRNPWAPRKETEDSRAIRKLGATRVLADAEAAPRTSPGSLRKPKAHKSTCEGQASPEKGSKSNDSEGSLRLGKSYDACDFPQSRRERTTHRRARA